MLGATLRGNLLTQFEFAGRRGYEAMGVLGALVGALVFGALGFLVARRYVIRGRRLMG